MSQDFAGASTAMPEVDRAEPASSAPSLSAAPQPAARSLMARLDTQPRVRNFLMRAVAQGRTAQAYLFIGPSGTGKLDAAWALAQALLCEHAADPAPAQAPCGVCDACIRVARHTHPDVHVFAPESATGYLIAQVRELLSDVALAPVRARRKVYIVTQADQLRANTANALLKTLEEPPANTVFVLLASRADAVLPTIVSRCQCVPFRLLSTEQAVQVVARATAQEEARCRMALSVAGSPARAIEFLRSAERQEVRRLMLRTIDALPYADEADILLAVARPRGRGKAKAKDAAPAAPQDIMGAVQAPLATIRADQEAMLEWSSDYLARGAVKQLEERNKRELTARERLGIMEALSCVRSLLRDVLRCHEGATEALSNQDAADIVDRLVSTTSTAGVLQALDAVGRAEERIAGNVSSQLALEVMLFDIRRALQCP